MGWANGSTLANQMWMIVRPHIDPYSRQDVAKEIIEAFEGMDCDTMDECEQLQIDATAEFHEIEDDWDYEDFNRYEEDE